MQFGSLFASLGYVVASIDYRMLGNNVPAANVLGYWLYRFSLGRERKLFLQSRRKNHVAELRRMKEQAEAAMRAQFNALKREIAAIDAVIMPATESVAPEHRPMRDLDYIYMLPASLTGAPVVVLPVPADAELPIAAVGAAAILGAWFFQYGLGLEPCPLCLEQRIPYYIAGDRKSVV